MPDGEQSQDFASHVYYRLLNLSNDVTPPLFSSWQPIPAPDGIPRNIETPWRTVSPTAGVKASV